MKYRKFLILLYYFLFWLLYFEIARIVFLLFNTGKLSGVSFSEIIGTFSHGILLDLSTISYITIFIIPVFIISAFFKTYKILKIALDIYTGILLIILSLIIVGDAETYKYWGFRLDDTPLQYLSTPGAMLASTTTWRLIFLTIVYLVIVIGMFSIYYHFIAKKIRYTSNERLLSLLYILIAGTLLIPIRGGIGIAPLNTGSAYHSNNTFLNHAAINVVWNFGYGVIKEDIDYENLEYFDKNKKDLYFSEANYSQDTSINVLNNKKPQHIIFIVLESFTSNAIGVLGGEQGLTSGIDKWSEKGILFNNFYANADRSDKGLVSIFSSIPTLLAHSLMKDPKKSENIPSIISELVNNGYKSKFYYGGDINFSNMNSYIKNIGFQEIVSQNNLKLNCSKSSKWGYHDECMFDLLYNDIINESDTSVFALFTLSSHEPYDVPGEKPFPEDSEMNKARNAYFYTDSCLNIFLEKMYNSPKWDNSLIILVSDHGTLFPGNIKLWELQKFHILMLWLGGALQAGPFIYEATSDQVDISATLLSQLNISHDKFIFSEDLFKKKDPNAFFSFNYGYGFIKNDNWYIYDVNLNKPISQSIDSLNFENYAKAYMQTLSEYYKNLERNN